MKLIPPAVLLPSWVVFVGIISARVSQVESSCLKVTGIESGGGEGVLDLDELIGFLEINSFTVGSGPPTISSCLAALETPVAMRQLLGELRTASQRSIFKYFGPRTVQFTVVQCVGVQQYVIRMGEGVKYSCVI